MREGVTVDDEGRALSDGVVASGFVGGVDDHGEVFGSEESGDVRFDHVESNLEPLRRKSESRESFELPTSCTTLSAAARGLYR